MISKKSVSDFTNPCSLFTKFSHFRLIMGTYESRFREWKAGLRDFLRDFHKSFRLHNGRKPEQQENTKKIKLKIVNGYYAYFSVSPQLFTCVGLSKVIRFLGMRKKSMGLAEFACCQALYWKCNSLLPRAPGIPKTINKQGCASSQTVIRNFAKTHVNNLFRVLLCPHAYFRSLNQSSQRTSWLPPYIGMAVK